MKEIFYFIRDKEHKPVISVCLLLKTDKLPMTAATRGVAICSDSETPCINIKAHQRNGPGIARKRAWKVWKDNKNTYTIHRPKVLYILDRIRINFREWRDSTYPGIYEQKGFYLPTLSPKEQRILAAIKQ